MPWFYKKSLQLEDVDGWYSTLLLRINFLVLIISFGRQKFKTKIHEERNNLKLPSLLLFSIQIPNLILQTTLSRIFFQLLLHGQKRIFVSDILIFYLG